MKSLEEQLSLIRKGTAEIISEELLVKKIEKSIQTKKPLFVKLGLDPSSPDIHLGHTVVLQKLKDFQSLGHQVQIIIGDFTGMIGDPTGKSKTRMPLTQEQVKENARTYEEQIFKVLDREHTHIYFNSLWLSSLNFGEVLTLASHVTVSQMMQRNDFSQRFQGGQPISLHEFFYPLMQGYDSVFLHSDIELGGTDQTFNLMMGKELQKAYGQEGQVAITMPIIEGLDGKQKMSKSLGNYIGVKDDPKDMFGKAMSIPDDLIVKYFTLLTNTSFEEIQKIEEKLKTTNPRDVKMQLANELVSRFHGKEEAQKAKNDFVSKFQKRTVPEEMPEVTIEEKELWVVALLKKVAFVSSHTEARQKIKEGAVRINGEKVQDEQMQLLIEQDMVVQMGKRRFVKLKK